MADTADLSNRTRFAARVIGPLMLIIGAVVIARLDTMVLMMPALLSDAPLMFITGIFALILGLILFAWHHHWSGLPAMVVSLIGVLTIVRGVLLMAAPELIAGVATQALRTSPTVIIPGAVALLLGVWLSFVGWFAKGAP